MRDANGDRAHWRACVVLGAFLLAGIALRFAHQSDVTSRSPDERTYGGYASRIADQGWGGFSSLFAEYLQAGDLWINPGPTRVGFIAAAAAAMKWEGTPDVSAAADLSLVCSILSLFLTAWIGARYFGVWPAAFAVGFQAASVADLGIARRAWSDSMAGLIGLTLVWIACEMNRGAERDRPRIWPRVAFLVAGTIALLSKEALALPYAICGVWLVGSLAVRRMWKGAALLALGGVASVAVSILVLYALAHPSASLAAILPTPGNWLTAPPSSWAQENYSGPWYQFVELLWSVGPLTLAMAAAGIASIIAVRRDERRSAALLAVLVGVCFAFLAFGPALKCLRLLSPVNGSYCLLAGLGVYWIVESARRQMSEKNGAFLLGLAILAIALEAFHNFEIFRLVVVRTNMEDLAISGFRVWLQ